MEMGRIIVPVKIENVFDSSNRLRCEALVDTGASLMVLPKAWKSQLGDLEFSSEMEVEVATQEIVKAEVCGPVRIQIEGFRPISSEVVFVDINQETAGTSPWLATLCLNKVRRAWT